MIQEPLFQKDIWQHIIQYMGFYLGYRNWFYLFCALLIFLYGMYKFIMYHNKVVYTGGFPWQNYKFRVHDKWEIFSFIFLILCIVFNIFSLFNQEMTFFANYDTRGVAIPVFGRGALPLYGLYGRFYPFAFWDTNIVYAVTHNFWLINIYLSIQSLIIVWLLNYFLKFMPLWKRCLCSGLIMISPVMFSVGSIIYAERLLMIYIIGSLICMQKYYAFPDKKYFLWFAVLLINFALYSKELSVLFYFGILVYYGLGDIWYGKITPKSFLSPIKTIKKFPFEFLLCFSIVVFSVWCGANLGMVIHSSYVTNRMLDFGTLFEIYHAEIIMAAFVVVLFIKKLFDKKNYKFMEGMALGSVLITVAIVFVFKMAQGEISRPYYLIIPHITGIIYILWHMTNKYIYIGMCGVFLLNSIFQNYNIFRQEDGAYYRKTAEFIMSGNENAIVNIFIARHSECGSWCVYAWRVPYTYYWPEADVKVFSSNDELYTQNFYLQDNIFYKKQPDFGDYIVVRKNKYYSEDLKEISVNIHNKVFENNMFDVYLMQ